jgi:hypothetical protein
VAQSLLEARLAARVAAALNRGLDDLPEDVDNRLRFAREQALARRAQTVRADAHVVASAAGGAAAALGGGPGTRWGLRLGMLLPVAALVAGVLLVQAQGERQAAAVAAQIDSALLADQLPPEAYADPGFAAFLKLRQP